MAPPCKYNTDEDRRNGYLEAQLRHSAKIWNCEYCNVFIRKGNKTNHLKFKKHIGNGKNIINEIIRVVEEVRLVEEEIINGGKNNISNENEENHKYYIIFKSCPPIVEECDKETS